MFANFAILLGRRVQSYFLWDVCFIILAHHTAKSQISSINISLWFIQKYPIKSSFFWITFLKISMDQKSKNKSCVRQCPKTIGKVSYKSKSKKQSYNSINEKFLKHVFSLWRNWWRQLSHTWHLTSPRTYGRKYSLSCWFYVKL